MMNLKNADALFF